jgi:hypothetical protein
MHEAGGADGEARVASRGLNVNAFERRLIENSAVGDAIEGDAARETNGFESGARMEASQHFEENLFKTGLHGGGDIVMVRLEWLVGVTRGTEAVRQVIGKHAAENGRLVRVFPSHLGAGALVDEILEAESKCIAVGEDDTAKLV